MHEQLTKIMEKQAKLDNQLKVVRQKQANLAKLEKELVLKYNNLEMNRVNLEHLATKKLGS